MTWQKGSSRWRCGLRSGHEGEHGEWVSEEEHKRSKGCGMRAIAPAPERDPVTTMFGCPWPECSETYENPAKARQHWYWHLAGPPRFITSHGTEAGYSNHRRLGEEACADCKHAHSVGNSKRRQGWVLRYPGPRSGEWRGR
jgi:hypothetical protein